MFKKVPKNLIDRILKLEALDEKPENIFGSEKAEKWFSNPKLFMEIKC